MQGAVEERCVLISIVERTSDGIVVKDFLERHFEFRIDFKLQKRKELVVNTQQKISLRSSSSDSDCKRVASF